MRARHKGKPAGKTHYEAGGTIPFEDEAQDKKVVAKEIGNVTGKSKKRLDRPSRLDDKGGHIKFHHIVKRERQSAKDRKDESSPFPKAAR